MEEANADAEEDNDGELQNRPPGDSDRSTGPLDLVFEEEDEVTIVDQKERNRRSKKEKKKKALMSYLPLKGPLGALVWQT